MDRSFPTTLKESGCQSRFLALTWYLEKTSLPGVLFLQLWELTANH